MMADKFFEFVHRPENENRYFELVRGELIELPPPTRIHCAVCGNITGILWNYTRQRGYGYVASNGLFISSYPDTVCAPDIALLDDVGGFEELHSKNPNEPPILAVEVLTPHDKISQTFRKIDAYLNNGVKVAWVIDPELQSVWVFEPGKQPVGFTIEDEIPGGAILPGFQCKVADFFFVPGKPPQPAT
jgi:Uma2 family endonuclease